MKTEEDAQQRKHEVQHREREWRAGDRVLVDQTQTYARQLQVAAQHS